MLLAYTSRCNASSDASSSAYEPMWPSGSISIESARNQRLRQPRQRVLPAPLAQRLWYRIRGHYIGCRIMDRSDQALHKVRELIEKRHFAVDGRLPPERSLATELRVWRRSLRRALEVPEQEGRTQRHQGRGTFVYARRAYGATMPT